MEYPQSADAVYDIDTSLHRCFRRASHNTTDRQSSKNIYFICEKVKDQNVLNKRNQPKKQNLVAKNGAAKWILLVSFWYIACSRWHYRFHCLSPLHVMDKNKQIIHFYISFTLDKRCPKRESHLFYLSHIFPIDNENNIQTCVFIGKQIRSVFNLPLTFLNRHFTSI